MHLSEKKHFSNSNYFKNTLFQYSWRRDLFCGEVDTEKREKCIFHQADLIFLMQIYRDVHFKTCLFWNATNKVCTSKQSFLFNVVSTLLSKSFASQELQLLNLWLRSSFEGQAQSQCPLALDRRDPSSWKVKRRQAQVWLTTLVNLLLNPQFPSSFKVSHHF